MTLSNRAPNVRRIRLLRPDLPVHCSGMRAGGCWEPKMFQNQLHRFGPLICHVCAAHRLLC